MDFVLHNGKMNVKSLYWFVRIFVQGFKTKYYGKLTLHYCSYTSYNVALGLFHISLGNSYSLVAGNRSNSHTSEDYKVGG